MLPHACDWDFRIQKALALLSIAYVSRFLIHLQKLQAHRDREAPRNDFLCCDVRCVSPPTLRVRLFIRKLMLEIARATLVPTFTTLREVLLFFLFRGVSLCVRAGYFVWLSIALFSSTRLFAKPIALYESTRR